MALKTNFESIEISNMFMSSSPKHSWKWCDKVTTAFYNCAMSMSCLSFIFCQKVRQT